MSYEPELIEIRWSLWSIMSFQNPLCNMGLKLNSPRNFAHTPKQADFNKYATSCHHHNRKSVLCERSNLSGSVPCLYPVSLISHERKFSLNIFLTSQRVQAVTFCDVTIFSLTRTSTTTTTAQNAWNIVTVTNWQVLQTDILLPRWLSFVAVSVSISVSHRSCFRLLPLVSDLHRLYLAQCWPMSVRLCSVGGRGMGGGGLLSLMHANKPCKYARHPNSWEVNYTF